MTHRKTQRGFSLVELMIAMVIGVVIVGGAISVYVSSVSSSTATLKGSKLNQELSALMNVMTNDIRRAGFWANSDVNNPQANPFAAVNDTALEVMDDMTNDAQVAANSVAGGECIVYSYDVNDLDGNTVNDIDIVGFRLNNGVVQMRQTGDVASNPNDHDNCSNANDTWLDVTDGNLITIDNLNFSLGSSECLNTKEPNGVDDDADGTIDNAAEMDCYAQVPANGSGNVTVETRQVTVSVTGSLVNDTTTTLTLTEDVRVRNDLVVVR